MAHNTPQEDWRRQSFVTTQWTLVLTAGQGNAPAAKDALEHLCRTYWYPLYAYARRKGISPHLAEDLVQGFFAQLLRLESLSRVDRNRGRFRSFLLASFRNYHADAYERATALKRGGTQVDLCLDTLQAEERYALEPSETASPETLFERRWALTLLEETLLALRKAYKEDGKLAFFDACRETLYGGRGEKNYAYLGQELGMSEAAIKMAVQRLRHRYRKLLLEKVRSTVESDTDVQEELNHLLRVVSA